MKKAAIWTLLITAITPLIVAPNLITYAVGGKVTLIRGLAFLAIALITLAVLFAKPKEKQGELVQKITSFIKKPLFIAVAANTFLLAVSTLFAYDTSAAFFGEPFRAEGFLTIVAFVTIFFGMLAVFGKKEWNRYFFFTWIISIVIFIFEMREVFMGMDRPDSLVGNPIFLSSYYLFSLFVAGYLMYRGRQEGKRLYVYLGGISVILFIVGIFLTDTRGTIFALGAALLVALIVATLLGKNRAIGKKTLQFWAGIAVAAILVFGGTFLATRQASFWQKIPGLDRLATTSVSEGTAASRIKFTQVSLNGFFGDSTAKTFLVGWGWDNYVYFFQAHYDPMIYRFEEKLADRAHNKLVDVLVMSGLLGIISYLAIWFYLFKNAIRIAKEKLPLGLLIVFFLVAFFINNLFTFDVGVTYLAFYALAAFILFTRYESR